MMWAGLLAASDAAPEVALMQAGIAGIFLAVVIGFARVQHKQLELAHAAQISQLTAANEAQSLILQTSLNREIARGDKLEDMVREQSGKIAEMNVSLHQALSVAGNMLDLIKGK